MSESPSTDPARLYRTVSMLADALERRRQKIAAGETVEPPPQCDCPIHRATGTDVTAGHGTL
jgi:hypothetical protein